MGMVHVMDEDNVLLAIIVKQGDRQHTEFFTPHHFGIQVGILLHPAKHKIPLHFHRCPAYAASTSMEVLHIVSGALSVNVHNADGKLIHVDKLNKGDLYIHIAGMHSFEVLQDVQILEVKQGPYDPDTKVLSGNV